MYNYVVRELIICSLRYPVHSKKSFITVHGFSCACMSFPAFHAYLYRLAQSPPPPPSPSPSRLVVYWLRDKRLVRLMRLDIDSIWKDPTNLNLTRHNSVVPNATRGVCIFIYLIYLLSRSHIVSVWIYRRFVEGYALVDVWIYRAHLT